jgi:hypothetical protein
MAIKASDIPKLTELLSPERLEALIKLTGSAEIAIELHQETLRVGAALMNVTATIEIALRNAIFENLSQYFGVGNWLQQPPIKHQWKSQERNKISTAVASARRSEYSKLSQAEKAKLDVSAYPKGRPPNTSHSTRARDRQRHIAITEGKVIAELTLFFWKRLYSPEYEQTLWRTSLKRTFPDKKLSRAMVAVQLEHLYQSRNRLAHHEPVLHKRLEDTIAAIDFITQRLGVSSPDPSTPLAALLADDIACARAKGKALRARLVSFQEDNKD